MLSKGFKQGCALSFAWFLAAGVAFAQTQTPPAPAGRQKPADAPLPPAQTLIDRHIEAVGGRAAVKSLNSIAFKGSLLFPGGITGTIEVFSARPNKTVGKMALAGIGEMTEGFDGTVGWSSTPMTGPMIATGKELEERAFYADFEGALNLGSRYEAMKTVEKTTFEGRPVYKIALTLKSGGEDIEFYDVETGLKAGATNQRTSPMGTVAITTVVSDYKKFGDILQPTVVKQSVAGSEIVMTFTSIEYNKVDPAVFALPVEIKALVK